jgi:hypothetical protein
MPRFLCDIGRFAASDNGCERFGPQTFDVNGVADFPQMSAVVRRDSANKRVYEFCLHDRSPAVSSLCDVVRFEDGLHFTRRSREQQPNEEIDRAVHLCARRRSLHPRRCSRRIVRCFLILFRLRCLSQVRSLRSKAGSALFVPLVLRVLLSDGNFCFCAQAQQIQNFQSDVPNHPGSVGRYTYAHVRGHPAD